MVINKNYIEQRMLALMEQAQKEQQNIAARPNTVRMGLNRINRLLPKWLKLMLRPLWRWAMKPVARMLRAAYKALHAPKETMNYRDNAGAFAVEFIQYCFANDVNFDTREYFPDEDEAGLQEHVDNRIKGCLYGYEAVPMNEAQRECTRLQQKLARSFSAKRNGFYTLSCDGRKYHLTQQSVEVNVMGYHYGMKMLPATLADRIKAYIAGKDFIDVGAYIGDSALMFLQYNPRKIYAYEPVSELYHKLVKTAEKDGGGKIIAVKKGIGDAKTYTDIAIGDSGSSVLNNSAANGQATEQIEIATLDDECRDRQAGVIKMDVEGFEYFVVKGGLETIRRDKPVIFISVYHTAKDFFEILPMIRACVPEYQFKYLDICPSRSICEKVVIAYI